jgi:hypothetical protein
VRELFNSMNAAELEKAKKRPGLCPRPRPHIYEEGQDEFPQLTTVNGTRDVPVLVAYAGLKKSWRKDNREFVDASTHLINHKLKTIPDIANFLQQYPPVTDDDDEESDFEELDNGPATAQKVDEEGVDEGWSQGDGFGVQEYIEPAPVEIDGGDSADDKGEDEEEKTADEERVPVEEPIGDASKHESTPPIDYYLSYLCTCSCGRCRH